MFTDKVNNLFSSKTEDEEEQVLGQLLGKARESHVNYGYRVFNVTKNKRVVPQDINNELDDELQVTLFAGEEPPMKSLSGSQNTMVTLPG